MMMIEAALHRVEGHMTTYWVEDCGDGSIRGLARVGDDGLTQRWSASTDAWFDAPYVIGDIKWYTGGREGWFRIPEDRVESAKQELRNRHGPRETGDERQPVFLVKTEGLTKVQMKQAARQALSVAQERGIVPQFPEPDGPPTSDA